LFSGATLSGLVERERGEEIGKKQGREEEEVLTH